MDVYSNLSTCFGFKSCIYKSHTLFLFRNKWIQLPPNQNLFSTADQMDKAGDTNLVYSYEKRAPHLKPPFTYGDIKKAVPPHCFERPLRRSFSYLVFDLSCAFILFYIATNYLLTTPKPAPLLYFTYWIVYSLVQGGIFSSIWFLGHECGHHAFSDYEWLDDIIGFILHSFILFPYFSFKYTHRRHHGKTGHLILEEVETPMTKSEVPSFFKYLRNAQLRFFALVTVLIAGVPLFLAVNFRARQYDRLASHYYPYSPMFSAGQRTHIVISDLGVLAVVYGLYKLAMIKGFSWIFFVYGGPYLVLNAIVAIVTILQHVQRRMPHYDSTEWDWLRGQLATVDRDFGKFFNELYHQAPNTHVAHHMFPSMPHYNCVEATKAFKPLLGDYYSFDKDPAYKAFWRLMSECIYVEEDESVEQSKGVYWYRNIKEL